MLYILHAWGLPQLPLLLSGLSRCQKVVSSGDHAAFARSVQKVHIDRWEGNANSFFVGVLNINSSSLHLRILHVKTTLDVSLNFFKLRSQNRIISTVDYQTQGVVYTADREKQREREREGERERMNLHWGKLMKFLLIMLVKGKKKCLCFRLTDYTAVGT